MTKLTKRFVEAIKPDTVKILKYWDSELKGFGVIVHPSGRCSYCIQYRNQQRVQKRMKLGTHGQITAEQARKLARKHLADTAYGEDPAEKKKQIKNLSTVKELASDYIERHGSKKRSKSIMEDRKLLTNIILPVLGDQIVATLSRREIENLHLRYEKTPYQANRILALLSKMFSLALSWGWRDDNPVMGIERYPEEKRDRWLDDDELNRLWEVLDRYPKHLTSYVFKFLLLTGARKGEVLNGTWDQFDLKQGIWTKPAHLTKQKKKEHLPLSQKAVELLHTIRELNTTDTPFLFPSKIEGQPIREVKTFWKTVLKLAKLENIRVHDLRHTHASHLVSSGLSLSIVGKLLGHTQASTTQRYAHLADEPLRDAVAFFGDKIDRITAK